MTCIIIISLFLVATVLYLIFGKCSPPGWEKKSFVRLAFAIEAISLFLLVYENYILEDNPNIIVKPSPGKNAIEEERILNAEGKAENYLISFDVPSRKLTDDEIKKAFKEAKQEIDETFLGQNEDVDHIEKKVLMNNSYQEGLISAEWRLDSYAYIYTDGTLKNDGLEEPVLCSAEVYLNYEDYGEVYAFTFQIVPVVKTPFEEFVEGIRKNFEEDNAKTATNEMAFLPTRFDNYRLEWTKKKSIKGMVIFSIGLIVLFGLGYGRVVEEKKKEKEKKDLLELGYSDMISNLSLLLGAGMSVRKAWEKMVVSGKKRAGPISPVFEEMEKTLNQMQTGKSEKDAIEEFGKRTRLPCYRKMSGILVNYIQKGSRDITNQLNNEVLLAFEEKKALAKLAGELAGTKLLVPMLMQLGVALVIIIVPAILSFSF